MTNREWINSLTDKELGYLLFCGLECDVSCMEVENATVDKLRCADCGEIWLKRIHKSDDCPDDFEKLKEIKK